MAFVSLFIRSTTTRATRILVALLFCALGLGLFALAVTFFVNPYLRPQRDTGMHREKLAELRAVASTVDVLVIGSSRLLEGFDPRVFASETARLGHPLRAYNLSLQRLLLWEQIRVIDDALAIPSLQPKLVLLEPAVGLGIAPENFTQARTVEFETPAAWRLAVSSILGSDRTFAHKGWNIATHSLVVALHAVQYGLYTNLVFPTPASAGPDRSSADAALQGFLPQPDYAVGQSPPAWLVDMRTEYVARFAKDSNTPGVLPAAMWASFLNLRARLHTRGIAAYFVQPPQLGFTTLELRELTFGFRPTLTASGGGSELLSYLDPAAYPELFDPRWWVDYNHLTSTGATLFTRDLARDVAHRLSPATP